MLLNGGSSAVRFNFKWQPFSSGFRFDLLGASNIKQAINHFEYHFELSSKSNLFLNMQMYSEINKENVFHCLPITFFIEINPEKPNGQLKNAIHRFASFYKLLEESKTYHRHHTTTQKHSKTSKAVKALFAKPFIMTYDRRGTPQYSRYSMPLCHFTGYNIWLLKPTHLNRGRGIHVFRTIEEVKSLITKYCHNNATEIGRASCRERVASPV